MIDAEQVGGVHILVVGDAMLDRYWFGSVERISPEAPVPIVKVANIEERPGGAANVAMNVAAIGARCTLISIVGADQEGDTLGTLLEAQAITARLIVDPAGSTVTKLRLMAQNQQLLRADFDAGPGDDAVKRALEGYEAALSAADLVLISDYGKGSLRHVEWMIGAARSAGKPVLVDPKGVDFTRYAHATIITPNLQEFEAVAGPAREDAELKTRALALIQDLDIEALLITRGDKGMFLVEKKEQVIDYPPTAKEVYDVSGAGDTAAAAFGIGWALAMGEEAAVRFANAAAGVVVGKLGTATASLEEINAALGRERLRVES